MKLNKISKSFFINLDRRTDRLDHIYKNTPFFTERFPAVDSKSLELTDEIRNLFPNGFYLQRKKSEIACCLSHYKLWKQLAEDEDADNYLILEDDVVFEKGFVSFWNNVWSHSIPSDYFLIFVGGCQPVNKPVYHKVLKPYNNHFNNVKPNNLWQGRTADDHYWHMNASSYIISKQCASLMCKWVDQHGFHKVLDVFMIDFVNKLFSSPDKLLHLNPLMARQLHEENDNMELDKNSDLRFDTDKFTEKTNSSYDVCFCCDSNLIEYAINPINALCQQNTNNNINIHFIYSGEVSDLKYIEAFISNKPNISFSKYIVNELNIPTNETWRSIGHLSNATNLKLQIPEILKDVSRVIYFDIDTIPYVDLSCFDKVSTESCGIAMRKEIKNGWRTFNGSKGTATENKNPIPFGDRVIGNSGVMVLDLVKLRKNNFTKFCLKEKSENNYNIPLTGGDQDLINIFCQCNFDILPEELNILVADQLNSINGNTFEFKHFDCFQENGVHYLIQKNIYKSSQAVLHFIGKAKPWNGDGLGFKFWSKFNITTPKIPKKIFQTWKTKDLNQGLSFLSKSFRDKNPEYEYFLYDDDDCRRLIEENFEPIVLEVYDRIIPGAFKADLWRYCALYVEGGIFCDMDMICMKNFDVIIHDGVEFFAPIDSNSRGAHDLYNAFMGSVPGHPILKKCIDTIVDNVVNETWRKKKQLPLDFSACGVLGRCVNNYIGREDFSSFAEQMGVHNSVKVLNYVKDHRYVEDKEGSKYVWSKDGNEQIRMITRQAEKEYKAEPWILSLAGGKMPYKQKNSINFHKESPEKIVDYFDIDCQLTKKSLSNIVKEIQDKKCNCNILVFGLGKDSVIYDTVNKGYTLFVESNQGWIDIHKNIKNKILYTFSTNVQDSLPINKDYLNQFEIPDFITKTQWDIVLIDGPPGDRPLSQGRALPIYWSSQIAQKYKTTIFIDDCCRDLEKEYCNKFFTEINFQMQIDTERGEFRSYKPIQTNTTSYTPDISEYAIESDTDLAILHSSPGNKNAIYVVNGYDNYQMPDIWRYTKPTVISYAKKYNIDVIEFRPSDLNKYINRAYFKIDFIDLFVDSNYEKAMVLDNDIVITNFTPDIFQQCNNNVLALDLSYSHPHIFEYFNTTFHNRFYPDKQKPNFVINSGIVILDKQSAVKIQQVKQDLKSPEELSGIKTFKRDESFIWEQYYLTYLINESKVTFARLSDNQHFLARFFRSMPIHNWNPKERSLNFIHLIESCGNTIGYRLMYEYPEFFDNIPQPPFTELTKTQWCDFDDVSSKQNEFIQLKNEWIKFKDYDFLNFIANNLPKRDVPKEKYTCYNPGQKIGIVSLYTPDISEYAIESEVSIRDYAFKQGYTFHVYRDKLDKDFHPNWSKPKALLNHFDDHEVVIWMDSDTIIFDTNQKFENILSECVPIKKIIACEDIGASLLNTGVLIFRNHKYTKNLITKWLNFNGDKSELYSSGGDQEVFCDILKRSDNFGNNRKIFPMSKFNTDPRFVKNDTFIMHFMAYGNTLKSVFMRYWGSK